MGLMLVDALSLLAATYSARDFPPWGPRKLNLEKRLRLPIFRVSAPADQAYSCPVADQTSSKSLARAVWSRLAPYHKHLYGAVALLVLAVPLVNFHPLVWGIVADRLMEKTLTVGDLTFWMITMFVTYVIGLSANAWHTYLLEKTGQAFVRDIRVALFEKFQGQSLSYYHQHHSGELVTRIVSDVDAMEQSVLQGVAGLLGEIVTFVVVAGMVLWISPLVGTVSILPLAFAFVFIRIYKRRVKSLYDSVRKRLGHIGAFVQDRLAGMQVTQTYGREAEEKAAFYEKAEAFYETSVRASRLRQTYFPLVSIFGFINNLIMLGVGGWLIMTNSTAFTIGALLAYRGFWWRLQSPIRTIAQTADILQRARASAERVFELLDAPVVIEDAADVKPLSLPVRGAVKFHQVSFHYVPEKSILRDVSFEIEPGEFVAVAGGSGSGKTTLLHLIPRFYEATSGQLSIDGQVVSNVALKSLRGPIGMVGQDSYLFDGSVLENLRYVRPEATLAEIEEAARAANAHEFVLDLPEQYDTSVGQNGVKLSGGQRQRLSLARAFLSQPKVLLLDEPTASVEPESESLIHRSILQRTSEGKGTTILVTHRVDLLRQAPRILFLSEGRLAADGSHAGLLKGSPAYREAYQQWEREACLASA